MQLQQRHHEPASATTLRFLRSGGPVVAVAGVCGGAGASAFAHLLAAAAARQSPAPVLLAETGGPTSSLGSLAGVSSQRSLIELARDVEGGHNVGDALFALTTDGLRVIASPPRFERDDVGVDVVEAVLRDARDAHGLTVVDCTSLTRAIDLFIVEHATHVAWIAPSGAIGHERTAGFVDALDLPIAGRELFVLRHDDRVSIAPTAWTALAERRDADVVLLPSIPDLETLPVSERIDLAAAALDAFAGALR